MPSKINFPIIQNNPALEICLFRNMRSVDICFNDQNYNIKDSRDVIMYNRLNGPRRWRIKLKECEPAVYKYYLKLNESDNRDLMATEYDKLRKISDKLSIVEAGGEISCFENIVTNNRVYILMAGPFNDAKEARYYCKNFDHLNHCNVLRKLEKCGSGIIEVFDLDNDFYAEISDYINLIPIDYSKYLELRNFEIPLCGESEKNIRENLFYQGGLQIRVDENLALAGANQIPLNLYLKGVLASEIGEHDSLEFIKTMAVVIRNHIFTNYKRKHFHEPFDFCCSGHCLRYYGIQPDSDLIDEAIQLTDGLFLQNDKSIYPAQFSYSCGGHTDIPELNGTFTDNHSAITRFDCQDPQEFKYKLTTENDAEDWILNQPEVFCRETTEASIIAPKLAVNSFRWEIFYTRAELENVLKEKTGENPGIIYEIIPISRSVSGRIKEIEILGSLKNVRVKGELNIRSALSETLLQSSCFIVNSELGEDGIPLNFKLIGAGNGHGVGLCKVGAAKLARDNYPMEYILNHYFQESSIQKKY